jgi:branched-chain amino acid transport system substrate-binding protein
MQRKGTWLAALMLALLAGACAGPPGPAVLRIGAVFPLSGGAAPLAADEDMGAQIAAELVNADGTVPGRRLELDVRDVASTTSVQSAVDSLRSDGVHVIIGAYSSSLSIPLAAAVAHDGMVYWETGAVADQVTGQGLPLVFRVGADGADLGASSARFVVEQLEPRLHRESGTLTAYLVTADDAYGHSVADGVRRALTARGVAVVGESSYRPDSPDWQPALAGVAGSRPDVLLLTSHIPDGIAFRRAFLVARLHVGAFVGTTMAQCVPDFGATLGAGAVGVFGSDRPAGEFNPRVLDSTATRLYQRLTAAWRQRAGRALDEEGLAGFTAAWVLFNNVLPAAHDESAPSIAAAARALNLPDGSLPNGGGVLFSSAPGELGQNLRAAATVEQWKADGSWPVVWPANYATGPIEMVPLPA